MQSILPKNAEELQAASEDMAGCVNFTINKAADIFQQVATPIRNIKTEEQENGEQSPLQ